LQLECRGGRISRCRCLGCSGGKRSCWGVGWRCRWRWCYCARESWCDGRGERYGRCWGQRYFRDDDWRPEIEQLLADPAAFIGNKFRGRLTVGDHQPGIFFVLAADQGTFPNVYRRGALQDPSICTRTCAHINGLNIRLCRLNANRWEHIISRNLGLGRCVAGSGRNGWSKGLCWG